MRHSRCLFAVLLVVVLLPIAASPAGAQTTPAENLKASRRDIIITGEFSDGLAGACLMERGQPGCRWHYLDSTGSSVLRTNLVWSGGRGDMKNSDPPPPFNEGLAATNDGAGKLAYMDKKAALVIRTDFPAIPYSSLHSQFKFEGDLAPVCAEFLPADNDGRSDTCSKWGYVNRAGKVMIPPELSFPLEFIEGLAVVQRNGKYGYINNWGHAVIAAKFEHAFPFSDGVAGATLGKKGVLIDKAGEVICALPPGNELPYEMRFSEGLSPVTDGGKRGFVDKACRVVIAGKFEGVYAFSEGLAAVSMGEKWGYIDKTGKTVIAPQFSVAYPFEKGVAAVYLGDEARYVDKTGRFVTETGQPLPGSAASTPAPVAVATPPAPTAASTAAPAAVASPAPNPNAALAAEKFRDGEAVCARYNYDQAVVWYREAVRLAPENAAYQHQLGFALHVAGKAAEGVPHLQKATELNPKNWEYLMHLADALTDAGQPDAALQAVDKALAIMPDNRYILAARKRALARAGRTQ